MLKKDHVANQKKEVAVVKQSEQKMKPVSVLFICIHNSARSQMAEAFTNQLGAGAFIAESAGLEPGKLNQDVVNVMQEIGIDISGNRTKDVFEMHAQGKSFDFVITVCDAKNAARCPVFPGKGIKIAWMFDDPSQFNGSKDEKFDKIRKVRDEIKSAVENFISSKSF